VGGNVTSRSAEEVALWERLRTRVLEANEKERVPAREVP
jgi:hypothetical protein